MASISKYLVTRENLAQWCAADESAVLSGSNVTSMTDLSGNGRTMVASVTYPTYSSSVAEINNMPAVSFSGSSKPFVYSGPVSAKHFFILASHTGATFSASYEGLIGGLAASLDPAILLGNASDTKFFNATLTGTVFYNRGTSYALSGQIAPMSGNWALIELHFSGNAAALSGLQVGQDRDFTARLWNGKVAEWMVYQRYLSDSDRARIYKYFANKYQHWEKTAGGLYYFPYTSDWGAQDPQRKVVLYDEAEDGSPVYRTKKTTKHYSELDFTSRIQDEMKAARAFYDAHHPGTQFMYRNKTVTPAEELTYRFAPDASLDAALIGPNRFNYKLKLNEV
jgi:hypothetical protein